MLCFRSNSGVPRSEFLQNSGDFWGVFRAATVALYIQELFGSFLKKKIRILELLGLFGSKRKLFGVFRAILITAQNFLCYFLKNSEVQENSRISGAGNSTAEQALEIRSLLGTLGSVSSWCNPFCSGLIGSERQGEQADSRQEELCGRGHQEEPGEGGQEDPEGDLSLLVVFLRGGAHVRLLRQ